MARVESLVSVNNTAKVRNRVNRRPPRRPHDTCRCGLEFGRHSAAAVSQVRHCPFKVVIVVLEQIIFSPLSLERAAAETVFRTAERLTAYVVKSTGRTRTDIYCEEKQRCPSGLQEFVKMADWSLRAERVTKRGRFQTSLRTHRGKWKESAEEVRKILFFALRLLHS